MSKFYRAAITLGGIFFGLVFVLPAASPAFAQGEVDIGSIYGAWQPFLLAVATPFAAAVVGLLAELLRRKFNLEIEAKHREALQMALTNGAGLTLGKLGNSLEGKTIDVKNAAIAAGVNYALKGAPAALKKFGLGPDDLARMIEAKLPQVANTAAVPKA